MSIKVRLSNMEKMMIRPEGAFRVDPVTGWFIVGGGVKKHGCLFTPPVSSPEQWLSDGNTAKDQPSQLSGAI